MTIFDLLAHEHGEVEGAFRDIHQTLDRARFNAFSTKLLACMRAEHAVVYPAFAYHAGLEDEVKRAIREHDKIEQAINHLRLVPLTPDAWRGALTRLQVLVTDHFETEEWILFPVARLRLTTELATRLATEFTAHRTLAMPTTACSITYDSPCVDATTDRAA